METTIENTIKPTPEIELSHLHIKKLTPYLDDILIPNRHKNKTAPTPINIKQRAFCWYYVHNGNNKADAYRKAFLETPQKLAEYTKKYENQKTPGYQIIAINAGILYRKSYVQEAIKRISHEVVKNLKSRLTQTLAEQLEIQATYDPSMFVNQDGSPAFQSWKEIPEKYRCCVVGIETKYPGGNKVVVLRLADREVARRELLKLCPDLYVPDKQEHLHKTIDEHGNEIGVNPKNMTTDELWNNYTKLKEREKLEDEKL